MIGAAEIVRAFCAYINKTFVLDRCGGEGGGHDGEGDEEEEAGLHGGGELVREGAQKIELDFYGGEAPLLYAAEGDFFYTWRNIVFQTRQFAWTWKTLSDS